MSFNAFNYLVSYINFPKRKFICKRLTISRSFSVGVMLFIQLISVIDLYLHGSYLYSFPP
jgi:hypothetical protein